MNYNYAIYYLSYALVLCAMEAATDSELKEKLMEWGMECIHEVYLPDSELLRLQQHEVPQTEEGKCMVACILKKAGWLDSNNKLNVTDYSSLLVMMDNEDEMDPQKGEEVSKQCINDAQAMKDEKGCERAAKLMTCLRDQLTVKD